MTPLVKDTSKKKKTKKVCPDEVSSSDKFFTNTNPFSPSFFLPSYSIYHTGRKRRTKRFSTSVNFNYRCNRRFFLFFFFFGKILPRVFSGLYSKKYVYRGCFEEDKERIKKNIIVDEEFTTKQSKQLR